MNDCINKQKDDRDNKIIVNKRRRRGGYHERSQ